MIACTRTNATAEGLIAKIQWIKYKARELRNRENFKTAIYLHCGWTATDTEARRARSPGLAAA